MSERELAGYVAPIIRSTDEKVLRRRVKTYDRDTGEVTGEVTMREVVGGLAQVTALGLEVVEGVRPKEVACMLCGKPVAVPVHGVVRDTACPRCKAAAVCSGGCGRKPPRRAFDASTIAKRNGKPWRCPLCAHPNRRPQPQQTHCSGGCGRKVPAKADSPAVREGKPWRCRHCGNRSRAMTPEIANQRRVKCAGVNCEAISPRSAWKPAVVAERRGAPWKCLRCACRARKAKP